MRSHYRMQLTTQPNLYIVILVFITQLSRFLTKKKNLLLKTSKIGRKQKLLLHWQARWGRCRQHSWGGGGCWLTLGSVGLGVVAALLAVLVLILACRLVFPCSGVDVGSTVLAGGCPII